MGTRAGAEIASAARLGIDVEEYRARRAAGQRWCHYHRAWHDDPCRKPRGSKRLARLAWIRDYTARYGRGPRRCDMARAWGISSKGTVGSALDTMGRLGLVHREWCEPRSTVVTGKGLEMLRRAGL